MTEFSTRLNGAGDRDITAETMEKSQHTDFNKDTTNESASGQSERMKKHVLVPLR